MAGRRVWWAAAAAVACLVAAGAITAASWPSTPKPRPSSTPVALPTVAAPSPTTPTRPPAPVVHHDHVRAAAPTHFVFSGPKFTVKAHVCGMPNVRPLDPPGEQHHTVCWVDQDFGVAPGSDTATTYVLGHAWAQDDREVLNPASELATGQLLKAEPRKVGGVRTYPVTALDGYRMTLRTATGTLVYTVRNAYGVAKDEAGLVPTLMNEKTKNRIALITCAERNGVDYDYDVIVEAFLTESISRTNPAS